VRVIEPETEFPGAIGPPATAPAHVQGGVAPASLPEPEEEPLDDPEDDEPEDEDDVEDALPDDPDDPEEEDPEVDPDVDPDPDADPDPEVDPDDDPDPLPPPVDPEDELVLDAAPAPEMAEELSPHAAATAHPSVAANRGSLVRLARKFSSRDGNRQLRITRLLAEECARTRETAQAISVFRVVPRKFGERDAGQSKRK
jgi:hypothetical protein